MHDKLDFSENVAVSANLGYMEFEIFCRAILISYQYPSLMLLNNVFIIQNFSINLETRNNIFPNLFFLMLLLFVRESRTLTKRRQYLKVLIYIRFTLTLYVKMAEMKEPDIEMV